MSFSFIGELYVITSKIQKFIKSQLYTKEALLEICCM